MKSFLLINPVLGVTENYTPGVKQCVDELVLDGLMEPAQLVQFYLRTTRSNTNHSQDTSMSLDNLYY